MIDHVVSMEELSPVKAIQWSGGTDIWLRRDIKGPLTGESEEGLSNTYYEAEEAFIRVPDALTEEEIAEDFDAWWERAAAYVPNQVNPPPDLEAQIVALQEQNNMLLECILEMSEAVYQ